MPGGRGPHSTGSFLQRDSSRGSTSCSARAAGLSCPRLSRKESPASQDTGPGAFPQAAKLILKQQQFPLLISTRPSEKGSTGCDGWETICLVVKQASGSEDGAPGPRKGDWTSSQPGARGLVWTHPPTIHLAPFPWAPTRARESAKCGSAPAPRKPRRVARPL